MKTIDPYERVGKYTRHLRQKVTEVERASCNFVILYVHGDNKFFIIPIKEISDHNIIIMYRGKDKGIRQFAEFEDKWELLE